MGRADILVRGAGIFGLSIAFACLKRGATVEVADPHGLAAGASGGIVGALAPHVPDGWNAKKAFQFESLVMAAGWWAEIEDLAGQSAGYARLGRLQPVESAQALALAEARADSARDLWRGVAEWRIIAADDAGSWAPVSPTGQLIRDTLSARLHPRQACTALAAAIRALGGRIVAEPSGSPGATVEATGHLGLDALGREIGRPVGTGVKGQAALLALDRRAAPQIFAAGVHVVPHADGTVAVGSTSERVFTDPAGTDAQLDDVVAQAIRICPDLSGAAVVARWAGVRPRARTRAPMLGPHPLRPGTFIANGGFKIGFGIAPKVGEVIADLVLDGRDGIPDGFRVEDNM